MLDLHWLPFSSDWRENVNALGDESIVHDYGLELVHLANHRLSLAETIKLDRVSQKLRSSSGLPGIRLALLSQSTVNHLEPGIRVGALRRGVACDVYTPPYDQYRQELLDTGSGLYKFHPDAVLFTLDWRIVSDEIPVDEIYESLRQFWQTARDDLNATVIQETILNPTPWPFGHFDSAVEQTLAARLLTLNGKIRQEAAQSNIILLDTVRMANLVGLKNLVNPVLWCVGKQLISPNASLLYGDHVGRVLGAVRGRSRKVLVLDLDNTLWGGVIGDDGVNGILLGQGSPVGEAYSAFQHFVKALTDRGVMLAVCSKNDLDTARAAFEDHPEMVLKYDDFVDFVANWNDKATNLSDIAKSLNLGIDSLVFFDDNPVERALVRQRHKMVAVPEVPSDPAEYVNCLSDAGYFEAIAFTSEDTNRTKQYTANRKRHRSRQQSADLSGFLKSLEMSMECGEVSPVELPRVVQLINKTNQFNLTTRRYTQHEIEHLISRNDTLLRRFRLVDKYGDNGLIAVVLLEPLTPDTMDELSIELWLMSCRVIGRTVEEAALNYIVEEAKNKGCCEIFGRFIPTSRNKLVENHYRSLGFAPYEEKADGASFWKLDLRNYAAKDTEIEIVSS